MLKDIVLNYKPSDRGSEALFIARESRSASGLIIPEHSPIQTPARRDVQWEMVNRLAATEDDPELFLKSCIDHDYAQGLNRGELLVEYATMHLAREFAYAERNLNRQGQLEFFVHSSGIEFHQVGIQRWLDNQDPYLPYYRGQTADLHRGGTPEEQLAQDLHRVGDTHSNARQLAGHMASAARGIIPAISITGPNLLPAVGIGNAINDRIKNPNFPPGGNFSKRDAIAVADLGDGTFAQGEVMEAISQAVKDEAATMFVGYNNLAAISMGLKDSSVAGDPILFARSFANHGLLIKDVDGRSLTGFVNAARDAVSYTRESRRPSLLFINNLYRVTDHTSSAFQPWYTAPEELERRKQFDVLPNLKRLYIEAGIATNEQLEFLEQAIKSRIQAAVEEVLARPYENPETVYQDVYAPEFSFGPKKLSENPAVPTVDHLQSTKTEGVHYPEKRNTGIEISGRMYENLVLAQEMRRDPRIVVYGEDIATIGKDGWDILPSYFEQKVAEKKDKLSSDEIELGHLALSDVLKGRGFEADPEAIAAFAQIMDGKGGVFRVTQFLDFLYGRDRLFNFPIREASIIGTATGRALAGEIPIVEIQFDAYTSPAYQQIHDYLSTLRWRGAGQFGAGMVIRMQGMNRVGGNGIDKAGGIGGIGHGAADITRFEVPGLRHFIPGDVEDMGMGLREAIRVARMYKDPVLFYEAINMFNDKGFYQGPEAHVPLGEAEVIKSGSDLLYIAWSNNVRIAKKLAETLEAEGHSVGVLNARSLADQFDWDTAIPQIKKANKIMIFEAGRKDALGLAGQIQQQAFEYLDSPIVTVPARYVPMPAGELNEAYVVPQFPDVLDRSRKLLAY